MKITSYNSRKITVINQEDILATINYPGWFSSTGEITIGARKIDVKKANFWGTNFKILRNGSREVGKIKLGCLSEIEFIDFSIGEVRRTFTLKRKGTFSWRYELMNEAGDIIAELKSTWKWSKFSSDLEILHKDETVDKELLAELLAYTGFIAHHHYRQTSSAG